MKTYKNNIQDHFHGKLSPILGMGVIQSPSQIDRVGGTALPDPRKEERIRKAISMDLKRVFLFLPLS
ncbi:hypothetical protein J2129_000188 [Methanofollis sp. W23]|uniref:hypothetical protein n=1 Tax=Methanofollis sp. W23 TaxID=2817849 RepID=UPI001AE6F794|nr:hypothetical protein [Methanofollis sp. W23]MBP2144734.1 hypothetical protein [Methanofollis sp. W23]